ncbi:hypothetical protein K435DRAFT_781869 [Dendrothele bispora CBS 962.96]|uniref:Uncharacterized protein n=1 Tax=Dendrothele bispora (strain CBS 962.96) TaxID=1314807 RepID=A0A4S8LID7_DENBC|nr:hypothetical protein K435DRAFT_781869 [Dendrothele bispora CBS 962.96]
MLNKRPWVPLRYLVPKSIYISNSEYRQYVIVPVETSISYHYIYCVSDSARLAGHKPALLIVQNSPRFLYSQVIQAHVNRHVP